MNRKDSATVQEVDNLEALSAVIVSAIQDVKGISIVKMDLREMPDASTDMFIICTGKSTTQVKGIIDNVERKVLENFGYRPNHVEGQEGGHWVLADYFNVLVHAFTKEKREFYKLDSLWSDSKVTRYEDLD
ncbi:MAG: ribosome silencing factor [Aureispira sp.]|nr:ribosome silencing factor [Aureispira sp.]